ncbi:MAG: hypothetical protein HKN47_09820 [Pirellulaceae bacterium]|nr:hypothetical protein [Pirellulaceae bacterium]
MSRTIQSVVHLVLWICVGCGTVCSQDDVPPDYPIRQNPKLAELYDTLTDLTADKRRSLQTLAQHIDAIRNYDPADDASFQSAQEALVALYGVQGEESNLKNVHWLLQVKAIDNEVSEKGAAIRNRMVATICEAMARDHGEVHRMDFSPASNLLNDIDQTFKAVARLRALGLDGQKIAAEFDERFKLRFKIPAAHLDVISHPFEARPPDWRERVQVHDFVGALRKGSALLGGNPEAYFLEGAFRMQVNRRSFEGDQELYTIFAHHPNDPEGATARMVVSRKSGTIRELSYKFVRPEIRRSYAWGSSVGNFWFYKEHGFGTRYAAKYGLRSFAEGPGWMAMFDELAAADPGKIPAFDSYEDMVDASARKDVAEKAFAKHFTDINLSSVDNKSEFLWTLNKAKEIRSLKDDYDPETAFTRDAMDIVDGDLEAFSKDKNALLKAAERRFKRNMTRIMVRNIEIALPARVADWIAPQVDPRYLGFSDEDIKNKPNAVNDAVKQAEKRLRVSALMEVVHGLKVLYPGQRQRVVEKARDAVRQIAADRGLSTDMSKALDAVLRIAQQENPRLLQSDEQAGRKRINVGTQTNQVLVASDDPVTTALQRQQQMDQKSLAATAELQEAFDLLRQSVDDASVVRYQSSWAQSAFGAVQSSLATRWDRAAGEFNDSIGALQESLAATPDNIRANWDLMRDPANRTIAVQQVRENAWAQIGYEASKIDGDPLNVEWKFRRDVLFENAVASGATWQNADAALKLIQAYRMSGGNWEIVRGVALTEMANRLPVVGEILDMQGILSGKTHPGMLAVKGIGFLYPGVGQALLVYSVADGTFALLCDIALESDTASLLQGNIVDASVEQAVKLPIEHPGFLRATYDAMMIYRDQLARQRGLSTDPGDIKLIDQQLARFTPDIQGAKRFVFKHFDAELEQLLDRKGVAAERRSIVKLSSNMNVIRSIEPEDMYDEANLPPLLRAFFRPVVRNYINGTGEFAVLPGHRAAHSHQFLKDRYFFTNDQSSRNQVEESLTSVLTAAYVNALVSRENGQNTALRIDGQWDKHVDSPIGPTAYIDGRTKKQITLGSPQDALDESLPGLPSILDVVPGDTLAEKRAGFLNHFDEILNNKLALRHAAKGDLPKERWLEFKLGAHHADLRPIAAEEAAVAHPLLTAFFSSRVMRYQQTHRIDPIDVPETSIRFESGILSGVNEEDTRDAAATRTKQTRERYAIDLRRRASKSLIALYRDGMLWEKNHEFQISQRKVQQLRLPNAFAMSKVSQLVFGDGGASTALPSEVSRTLGIVSGDPRVFDDESVDDPRPQILKLLDRYHAQKGASIELSGVPAGPITPDTVFRMKASVAASTHHRRPLAVRWSLVRGGSESSKTQPLAINTANLYLTTIAVPESKQSSQAEPWKIQAVLVDADNHEIAKAERVLSLKIKQKPPANENVRMMVHVAEQKAQGAAAFLGFRAPNLQTDQSTRWEIPSEDNCRAGNGNTLYLWLRWPDMPRNTTQTKLSYKLTGGFPHLEQDVTSRVVRGYDDFVGASGNGNAFIWAPFSSLRGGSSQRETVTFTIQGKLESFNRR